ncbi:MAG: DUF4340 domain-containing protein [Planctomycetes bacterium]|nr:DUF4340 domain-containing protein [Planctomycetota bacterium]
MNLKTTIALVLLVGAGAGGWTWLYLRQPPTAVESPTLTFLKAQLPSGKLTRIEATRRAKRLDQPMADASLVGMFAIAPGQIPWQAFAGRLDHGPRTLFVLQKVGQEWTLPGNWPVRPHEAKQWIATLTSLHSRFEPISLDGGVDIKTYGLYEDPLTIEITIDKQKHTLLLGEKPGDKNTFTSPTYLRLDDKAEVIQLGPGVLSALDRTQDYFQQRRLFPLERVARDEDSTEKVEQVAASKVTVETKDTKVTVARRGDQWILQDAKKKDAKQKAWKKVGSEDRLDPSRRDALLRACPEIWAEKFVDVPRSLVECGLDEPEYTVSVTRANGSKIKLLIGGVSHSTRKMVLKQMGKQLMPIEQVEEYRYAKLDENDQLFEIKTDKLKDLAVDIDALRDAKLARFKTDDVKRLELVHGAARLVFVKKKEKEGDEKSKEKWTLEKPSVRDVEAAVVEDFIDKLQGLQVSEKEILDDADLQSLGLAKPAGQIKIVVEEADKDAKKGKDEKKKSRTIVFYLGQKPKDADKTFIRVDDWPRVNQVGAEIWKLAQRSEVAYRPRELWKLDADTITKITIDGGKKAYSLQRGDKAWRITGPLDADASGNTADTLAEELARLKAERFEDSQPKELAKFGLDKPAFKITLTTKEGKPRQLEIGKRIESKEGGRFARLAGGDAVFVINEKLAANLKADPFDLVEASVLTIDPKNIERIRYQEGKSSFTLESQKGRWQITASPAGPFPAGDEPIKMALAPWAKLRADRIAAVGAKLDLAAYGLAPPAQTIVVTLEPDAKSKAKKPIEHTIELGKQVDASGARFARVDKKNTVVVFDALTAGQLARSHLDFLDPRVLRLDAEAVVMIDRKMNGADLELARRDDVWQIVKPSIRDADNLTLFDLLRRVAQLRAVRIADYPAKDLKPFGLEKPLAIVTIHLELGADVKKHVIKVGDIAPGMDKKDTGERYAQIDDQKMVVVLPAELSRHLIAGPLYFADRNLAAFGAVDRAELTKGSRKATFGRTATAWEMIQPEPAKAESEELDGLIRLMQRLRAEEIVVEKAADLKKFGLDKPAAEWRFKLGTDEKLHLLVGAPASERGKGLRYAKLGDKNAVFLLSDKIAARTLAEYRDRAPLAKFEIGKAVKLVITTGKDKPFTLEKKDGKWVLASDTKATVKPGEVQEVLFTLVRLEALRYVADAKADLKQYGLDAPSHRIEVQLPVGKRELWVGDVEEKSKRRFATVPGTGAVFVLDEFDTGLLTRPLSSFLDTPKKK